MTSSEAPAIIANLRREIDELDGVLVGILRRRAALSVAVAIAKTCAGIPIHDPAREETLIRRHAPFSGVEGEAYREVIRVCREHSKRFCGEQADLPGPDDGGDPGAPA